jgi:hypothetical protein
MQSETPSTAMGKATQCMSLSASSPIPATTDRRWLNDSSHNTHIHIKKKELKEECVENYEAGQLSFIPPRKLVSFVLSSLFFSQIRPDPSLFILLISIFNANFFFLVQMRTEL